MTTTATAYTTLAPAKVNLYLHVLGRRPDGLHRLDSLIVFAAIGDTLAAARSDRLSLAVSGAFADATPTGPDNLVLRAAEGLASEAGLKTGARLRLVKRLPVAAGIGGGSADCAAALRLLARLWDVPEEDTVTRRLAPRLGADVPVCLASKPAFVGGIGERLTTPPPLPPAWLVLANPGVPVATAQVFRARANAETPFGKAARFRRAPADARALAQCINERNNDLADAALAVAPAIGPVLAALTSQPGALAARLSGSGATCFGLFGNAEDAHNAARTIRNAEPDWWVADAPLLEREPPLAGIRAPDEPGGLQPSGLQL